MQKRILRIGSMGFVLNALVVALVCALSGGMASEAFAQRPGTGTSVEGDEAREVYNTCIALGATRVDIRQGPTVIIDRVDCQQTDNGAGTLAAMCKFQGDPKLSKTDGANALRLVKALLAMGVKKKTIDAKAISLSVTGLNCGLLRAVPEQQPATGLDGENFGESGGETASCYFVDQN